MRSLLISANAPTSDSRLSIHGRFGNAYTVHDPPLALIVVNGAMHRGSVVPDEDIAQLPAMAVAEVLRSGVAGEKVEKFTALR